MKDRSNDNTIVNDNMIANDSVILPENQSNACNWQDQFSKLTHLNTHDEPELGISLLDNWQIIKVVGSDAKSYLQGQITCDVNSLTCATVSLSAHCSPKGKVLNSFYIFAADEATCDNYMMLQPKSAVELELKELSKYAVFAKVTIKASNEIILGVTGKLANKFLIKIEPKIEDLAINKTFKLDAGYGIKLAAQKEDEERYILILKPQHVADFFWKYKDMLLQAQFSDSSLWQLYDIKSAIGVIYQDAQAKYIPQALNLQSLGALNFTKGCYVGQETIARAKYRGTNKRALFLIEGHSKISIAQLSKEIERKVGDNWRSAGDLLNYFQYSDGTILALIVLPNDLPQDTPLRLSADLHSTLHIKPLPYILD